MDQSLFDKHYGLYLSFLEFWQNNFSPECQEGKDSDSFQLGARIRYGLACVIHDWQLPENCSYESLVSEVDDWIAYREGQ